MRLDASLSHIQESGFCVLPGVIPTDRCGELRKRITQAVAAKGWYAAPGGMNFLAGVINHDQSFASYLADHRLLEIITALLGDHVRISFTSAIINPPGSPRGGWHADWPFNQQNAGHVPAPYPDAVMHLTTLWMLSPFSAVNGGTLALPGSHRRPTNPTAPDGGDPLQPRPDEVHVAGPPGAVCIMDSRLWHATSPNSSSEDRVALVVRYAP
jgi:ectoine hydroxylase-related dioxygenase (phytanoyl-CoA dioxygenase family)